MKYTISTPDQSEEKLFYNCDDEGIKAAKIGHLRMDFGNGRQFFSTWWDNGTDMNDGSFKRDLGRLIDSLRKTLLSDRALMADFIRKTDGLDLGDRGNGFKMQTDENVFFLLCLPKVGEYDCYCYCYDRRLLEQAMSQTDSEDMAEKESGDMTIGETLMELKGAHLTPYGLIGGIDQRLFAPVVKEQEESEDEQEDMAEDEEIQIGGMTQ